jgi:signal transduction histidine kinase
VDACTELPEPAAVDPAYAFLALYAPDGRVVCESPVGSTTWPSDTASAGWFQATRGGTRGIATPPILGPDGRWLQGIAEPVGVADGPITGVIVLASDLLELQTAIDGVGLPRDGLIRVSDADGAIVASSVDPAQWLGTDASANPTVAQLIQDPSRTPTGQGLWIDGVERIFAAAPVDGWGGLAIVSIPTSVTFEPIQQAALRAGAILLAVAFIGVAVSVYLSSRIAGPIRRLASTADAYAAGRRDVEAPTTGPSEVAKVGRSFNAMVAARERAEEEARFHARRLVLLHDLDQSILAGGSPAETSRQAMDWIGPWMGALRASIVQLTPKGPVVLAVHGSAPPGSEAGRPIPFPTAAVETILADGSLELPDLQADPRGTPYAETFGAGSGFGFRLDADGVPIGILTIFRATPGVLTDAERDVLREVADEVAIAIHAAALREQIASHAAELEERVRARTQELQELNTELDAFSATVSHDLRAPLRHMRSFASALLEDEADVLRPNGRDYAERIANAGARMEELVVDLLEYSRLSRAHLGLRPVPLGEAVDEAISVAAGEGGQAEAIRVEGDLPAVVGHPKTLVRVIANLLSNALKFVAPGTTPQVVVTAEQVGPVIRLWVADNGIGVAPEYRDWVFRTFERLHGMETYPGTGIGLAIVRKGMDRMGGRAGIESVVGKGSRFWIELPAATTAAEAEPAASVEGV